MGRRVRRNLTSSNGGEENFVLFLTFTPPSCGERGSVDELSLTLKSDIMIKGLQVGKGKLKDTLEGRMTTIFVPALSPVKPNRARDKRPIRAGSARIHACGDENLLSLKQEAT